MLLRNYEVDVLVSQMMMMRKKKAVLIIVRPLLELEL
jgi:hypothetical protein